VILVDARSQMVLSTYKSLAKDLAMENLHPLAAVDCYGWTDVCQLANVSSYPLIRIYRPHSTPVRYTGYLSKDAIYAAVKLYVLLSLLRYLCNSSQSVSDFLEWPK